MRVVLLVTDLEPGGTPLRLARLARGLRREGIDVHVGCLAPPGPVSAALTGDGIPTFAANARHSRDVLALWRLARILRRLKPDVLHATLTHANVAGRLVGRTLGIPVITSTATIEVERRWHARLERWTRSWDGAHVVNSEVLAAHVERTFRVPRAKIHVVPPLVDPLPDLPARAAARRHLQLPDDEFVVLWIGRFDPVKRIELVVHCARLMATEATRFVLAGDGADRPRIEMGIRRCGVAERVHLLGWREDLHVALAAADAFLFPSRTEGMPNAVLQALAAGLPVVASDIPALRELAGGAAPRMLLIPNDVPEPFADALRQLRSDTNLRETLARRARQWAQANLQPRRAVAAVLDVYREVLGEQVARAKPD